MALVVGVNTFISSQDADTYFSSHIEKELWEDDYDDEKKEAALAGAFYRILSACTWDFQSDSAPEIVKIAQCEWALELSKKQTVASKTFTPLVEELGAGPAKIKLKHKEEDGFGGVNDWIKTMLSRECQCSFAVNENTAGSSGSSHSIISY